jgi:hypothetical protein
MGKRSRIVLAITTTCVGLALVGASRAGAAPLSVLSPAEGSRVPAVLDVTVSCTPAATIQFWGGSLTNNGAVAVCLASGQVTQKLQFDVTTPQWRTVSVNQSAGGVATSTNVTWQIDPALPSGGTTTTSPTTITSIPTTTAAGTTTTAGGPTTVGPIGGSALSIVSPAPSSTVGAAFTVQLTCRTGSTVQFWDASLVNNGQQATCPASGSLSVPLQTTVRTLEWRGVSVAADAGIGRGERASVLLKIDPAGTVSTTTTTLVGTTTTTAQSAGSRCANSNHLFAFIGQSNMSGQGDAAQSVVVPPGVANDYRLSWNGLLPVADPVGEWSLYNGKQVLNAASTGSLVPGFVKQYNAATGKTMTVVHAARGGAGWYFDSGWGSWRPGGDLINAAFQKIDAAIAKTGQPLNGIVALGGETDGGANTFAGAWDNPNVFKQGFRDVLRAFHNRYNAPMYFILPGWLQLAPSPWVPGSDWAMNNVRQAMVEVMAEPEFATYSRAVYRTENLRSTQYILPDGIHYNQTGLNKIGTESAANVAANQFC